MKSPKVYREFFDAFLPEDIKKRIDLSTIAPTDQHYVDAQLRPLYSDCLFEAPYGRTHGYIYLLIEHFSAPKRDAALRIHRYMGEI